jgi:hypothetical protein
LNLDEFYAQDPRRKASPEADYGVWWYETGRNYPAWRVSYIQRTGEVYAVSTASRFVMVLGTIPPDAGDIFYRTLDRILVGWAEECGKPNSLAWVRKRLAAAEVAA